MKRRTFAVFVVSLPLLAVRADKKETSHIDFVAEYVRELAQSESLRSSAAAEARDATSDDLRLAARIHGGTMIRLELGAQISALKRMRLNPPFQDLIPGLITLYGIKIVVRQQLIDIFSKILTATEKDVDGLQKELANIPKLQAKLDSLDRDLWLNETPLVFATLLADREDSLHHQSHLIITKAEKSALIDSITATLSEKLDQAETSYFVKAAALLKAYLEKGFLGSDEPWK